MPRGPARGGEPTVRPETRQRILATKPQICAGGAYTLRRATLLLMGRRRQVSVVRIVLAAVAPVSGRGEHVESRAPAIGGLEQAVFIFEQVEHAFALGVAEEHR